VTQPRKRSESTLDESDITTHTISRRSTLALLSGAVVAMAVEGCHHRGIRGCTDSDPMDRAGYGRRCGGYYGEGYRCSDRDPYDPAGNGRHC
jgi:hypothetical protein